MSRIDARALLRAAGLTPKRSFGQSFLISAPALRAIAQACVADEEVGRAYVIEIGAGLGALTEELAARAAKVVAIERDRDLVPLLRAAFQNPAVEVMEADAQSVDLRALLAHATGPRVLCGNLPYQITGRLLEHAALVAPSLDRAVFMVQAEVAARLVAKPASKDYGALTVFTRAAFDATRLRTVSAACFYPRPEVESAVVELRPVPRARETEAFRAVVRAAFTKRRKTLRNAWRELVPDRTTLEAWALRSGVSLDARGETLDIEAFVRAAEALEAL